MRPRPPAEAACPRRTGRPRAAWRGPGRARAPRSPPSSWVVPSVRSSRRTSSRPYRLGATYPRMNETKRPRSWWLREALADDPGEPCPPLERDVDADVLVIGGGYTGMWTAHFIKEAEPDRNVVLLEKDICGGGPSGRNGGVVNALLGGLEAP